VQQCVRNELFCKKQSLVNDGELDMDYSEACCGICVKDLTFLGKEVGENQRTVSTKWNEVSVLEWQSTSTCAYSLTAAASFTLAHITLVPSTM
jgi:hypothetical protein